MKRFQSKTKVRGVALFLSLVLLVVLTVVAVAMMSNTGMQERMAGNQKRITDASMAAEAGIAKFYEWIVQDVEAKWGSQPEDLGNEQVFGTASRYTINGWKSAADPNRNTDCETVDRRCIVEVTGESFSDVGTMAQVSLEAEFIFDIFSDPIGGGADILCGGSLDMKRIRFSNTYAHCDDPDGIVSTSGQGGGQNFMEDSRITSAGEVSVGLRDENCDGSCERETDEDGPSPPGIRERVQGEWYGKSFFDNVQAPPASVSFFNVDSEYAPQELIASYELDPMVTEAGTASYMGDVGALATCGASDVHTCDFTNLDESSEPRVLFCNGNINFGGGGSSPISNLIVIATCDITHNGQAQQGGGDEINNTFYAGGNMEFNGRTGAGAQNDPDDAELFSGRFFSGGDIVFNGNVSIEGQVIAEGDITANGWLTFEGARKLGGAVDTSEEQKLVMTNWLQRWFDE